MSYQHKCVECGHVMNVVFREGAKDQSCACPECGRIQTAWRQPIAVWGICNAASLNVWEMQADESMLVGINDDEPEWVEIQWVPDSEETADMIPVIDFHGTQYRLDECIRTGGPWG